MGIRQLRYFVTVAEAKSFTKAATSLQVAQPAIGVQIRKLEETLGVKLLVRHSRGVETTEAGAVLVARAQSLLQDFDQICQEVADVGGKPSGRVVVGMTKTVMHLAAARLTKSCEENYPSIDLVPTENMSKQVMQGLIDHSLDLGLAFTLGQDPRLETRPLAIEALMFAAPVGHPAIKGRKTIHLKEVLEHAIIVPSKTSPFRQGVERAAKEADIVPRIAYETNSVSMIKDLVCNDVGCAIVSYGSVISEVQTGQLGALRITDPEITRTLYLSYSKTRVQSKAMLAVRDAALSVIDDLITGGDVDWRSIPSSDGSCSPNKGTKPLPSRRKRILKSAPKKLS